MNRKARFGRDSVLVVSFLVAAARSHADPPPSADKPARPPDYKIAFWYLRADPLNSIRHRAYDVRKGQYTRAVDDWLRLMRPHYPGYEAYVKELRLEPAGARDEKSQLATAVLDEYQARGGPDGGYGVRDVGGIYGGNGLDRLLRPGGATARPGPAPGSRTGASLYLRGYGFVPSPGANRPPPFLASPSQSPQGIPTPFPYPYVRPHP